MSNRENPSAGHLIEASKLAVFLPDDRRPAFDKCLREHDFDEALSMLDRAIPDGVASPSQIFVLSDYRHRRRRLGGTCSLCLLRGG